MLPHFLNEDDAYYRKSKFYNHDETYNEIRFLDRLEYLNKLVKSWSFSNKLVLTIKKMETDLPVAYL